MDDPRQWARWWLWLWAIVAVVLLAALRFVSFEWWSLAMTVGFGSMETIGVVSQWRTGSSRYPPLTHVIGYFLPRQIALAAIGFWVGVAGGMWFAFPHPWKLGALLGLW